jgi:hypothetical protein
MLIPGSAEVQGGNEMLRAALDRWEQCWRDLGFPVDDDLMPGLSLADVRGTLEPLGPVPDDVITWFGWHNGSRDGMNKPWAHAPTGSCLISLDLALEHQATYVEVTRLRPEDGADRWEPTWLPLIDTDQGDSVSLDLVTGEVRTAHFWPWSDEHPHLTRRAAPDLASIVTLWCDVLDAGYYAWHGGNWKYDTSQLPRDLHTASLIR